MKAGADIASAFVCFIRSLCFGPCPSSRLWRAPDRLLSFARSLVLDRRVVSPQPAAQAIETGKENALGDVGLVELVADLPLRLGRNDQLPGKVRPFMEPSVELCARIRHQGEKGELVDDPVIERGRLEK